MLSRASSASLPDAALRDVIIALVLAAWCALWLVGRSPYAHLALHGPAHQHYAYARPAQAAVGFVAGWTLMTVAMMLPSSFPLILMFHRMVRSRPNAPRLIALLIAGYLSTWVLCGALLLLVNWLLHNSLAALPWASAMPWIAPFIILTVAGLYQFSSLKYACLERCRSPLSFLIARWRGGSDSAQALSIGLQHGLFCVGCCWSLMLLMFLVSITSLFWMLLLAVAMSIEKNLSWGRRLAAPLGGALLLAALAVAVTGARSSKHSLRAFPAGYVCASPLSDIPRSVSERPASTYERCAPGWRKRIVPCGVY